MKLRFFLTMFFLVLCLCVGQTQADEIARYMFDDGTFNDTIGAFNGSTGTGDPEVVDDPERGKVLYVDGDDGVDIPFIASDLDECTISMWIKNTNSTFPTASPHSGYSADVWSGTGYGDNQIHLRIGKTGVAEFCVIRAFHGGSNLHILPGTTVLAADTWYHIAGTFKKDITGTERAYVYVNGVSENDVGTENETCHLSNVSQGATTGGTLGGMDNDGVGTYATAKFLTGYIDEVRMFNHVLTQEEVAALMVPPPPPDPYVSAGPDKVTVLPTNTVTLAGEVEDNGDPNHVLSYWFDEVSKPAGATISLNPNTMGLANRATMAIPGADPNGTVVDPIATMDTAGIYELLLTGWDDENDANDTVQIWVYPSDYLGLVALWELEQNANADAAGKFYVLNESTHVFDDIDTPGTLVGDPNWTDGPDSGNTDLIDTADFGYAITLDHDQEECIAIQGMYYDSDENEELTVCAWIKPETGDDQIIASFDRGEYWRLAVNSDDAGEGQVGFGINTSSGVVALTSVLTVDELNEVTGEPDWHHVAAIFDNGEVSLYVDGVLNDSDTGGDTFGSGLLRYGFIGVGSEADAANGAKGPETYFNGSIDDVRIYNVALTSSELLTVADIANGPPVADAGPDLRLIQDTDGDSIELNGASVTDVPGNVKIKWNQLSGPGTLSLPAEGSYDPNITVSFAGEPFGLYELKLTATDLDVGEWTSEDAMLIMYQEKAQYSTDRSTPMAHWKLDESSGTTAADSSGNGLNGTVKSLDEVDPNLPLFDDDGGKIDGALDFINFGDDVDQYVDLRNTPSAEDLTVMFWMKPDVRANMIPLDRYPTGPSGSGWVVKLRGDGRIWFMVGSSNTNDSVRPLFDAASYDPNAWTHITCTYDAETNTIAEYVNGLSVANKESTNQNIGVDNFAMPLQMALASEDQPQEQFRGLLDHVRIYDIALSPIDIALQAVADTAVIENGCYLSINEENGTIEEGIEGQKISQDISGPDGVPDCYVNLFDLAEIAAGWLECTDIHEASCWP